MVRILYFQGVWKLPTEVLTAKNTLKLLLRRSQCFCDFREYTDETESQHSPPYLLCPAHHKNKRLNHRETGSKDRPYAICLSRALTSAFYFRSL